MTAVAQRSLPFRSSTSGLQSARVVQEPPPTITYRVMVLRVTIPLLRMAKMFFASASATRPIYLSFEQRPQQSTASHSCFPP